MLSMISCALSPNTEPDDVFLALKLLCMPWAWKQGDAVREVEKKFGGVAFNSGRVALLAILTSFHIGKGDEVVCQAFTCVAVSNSVRWIGATPVFADITDSYTLDPKDLEKKITSRTRAVIVQHTFGIAADMKKILSIAKKHKIKVIEDFAHTMSLPMRGDAAFYSFGRDKVLSSVFGGLAVGDTEALKKYQQTLEYPSLFWIFQQLLHPIAFAIILFYYPLGKFLLVFMQKIKLLSFPVYPEEKLGKKPSAFPARYPNALAVLLLHQLKKLQRFSKNREEIVALYGGHGVLLRYPAYVDDPKNVLDKAKKQGILLGNWYHHVIDPADPEYTRGSCPKAENAAKHIVNLPTRIPLEDAKKVLATL